MKWIVGTFAWVIVIFGAVGCLGSLTFHHDGDDDVIGDDDTTGGPADDDDTGGTDDDSADGPCGAVEVSYDFESGDEGFSHGAPDSGFDDPWELGAPAFESCHSGESCWATDLGGMYGDCEAGELLSPMLDLSACSGSDATVTLRFWHLYRYEVGMMAYYDGGAIQLSTDGGDNWLDVSPEPSYTGPITGTYDECGASPSINNHLGWSEIIPGDTWSEASVDLGESYRVDDLQFRFLFGSDRGEVDEGWYVDDIEIVVE